MFKLDRSFENDIKKQGDGLFRQGEELAGSSGKGFESVGNTALSDYLSYHVSSPDDPSEIQAERKADQVMSGGDIQRDAQPGAGGGEVSMPYSSLGGGGESLSGGLQESMESSFGRSFSDVRIHNDRSADDLSRGMQAKAFTSGSDIFFKEGAYKPDSSSGQHLIAHELAHVAQNDAGLSRTFDLDPIDTDPPPSTDVDKATKNEANKIIIEGNENKLKNATLEIGKVPALLTALSTDTSAPKDKLHKYEKIKDTIGDGKYVESSMTYFKSRLEAYAVAYRTAYSLKPTDSDEVLKVVGAAIAEITTLAKTFENDALLHLENSVDGEITTLKADTTLQSDSAEMVTLDAGVKSTLSEAAFVSFTKAADKVKGISSLDGSPSDVFEKNKADIVKPEEEMSTAKKMVAGAGVLKGVAGVGIGIGGNVSDFKDVNSTDKTESDATGGVVSLASAGVDAISMGMEAKEVHESETKKQTKIDALGLKGKVRSEQHADRIGLAGQGASVLGGATGAVGQLMGGDAGDATQIAGSSMGVLGDTLGMGADSYKIAKQKSQDAAAKAQMAGLADKLDLSTHQTPAPPPPATGKASPSTDLQALCANIKTGKKLSTAKDVAAAIKGIMDQNTAKKYDPELNDNQKSLLKSINMLQVARQSSRGNAKEMRFDIAKDVIGTVGDLASLTASILKISDNKLAGAIVGVIGTLLGTVRTAMETAKTAKDLKSKDPAKAAQDTAKKQDSTGTVTTGLIEQLRGLPLFPAAALATGPGKVTKKESQDATAYADAYKITKTTLAAANMDMISFLYACDQNNKPDTGTTPVTGHGDRMKNIFTRMVD